MGLSLVNDLAEIGAVPQHQVERAAREWLTAEEAAGSARPRFALDAAGVELLLHQPDRAEFGIAAEDRAHDLRLAVDDNEFAILYPIPERRRATHPHPLPFRGGDLVADALADDLALELRKRQKYIERQAPHRARRIELLRHRNEGGAPLIEDLDDLGKIGERAGQPVDLVDDDGIDPTRRNLGKQSLQSRSIDRRAGEPAIVVSLGEADPAFVPLA